MSDDFDLDSASPDNGFDLGSATPAGSGKVGMEALKELQPTYTGPASTLREGNPVEGAMGTAVGVGQNLGAGLLGNLYGIAKRLGGAAPQEAEAAAADLMSRWARHPSTQKEQEYTEALGNTLGTLPPVLGDSLGVVPPMVSAAKAKVLGTVAKAVSPSEEALALARKAQNFGLDLRPDMLYNNKFMKLFGEISEHVPMSGGTRETRHEAFTNALVKQIGGDPTAKRLTPDVYAAAMEKSGKTIGDLAEKTAFPIDDKFRAGLATFARDLEKATPGNQQVVMSYIKDLGSKQDNNGVIQGGAVRELNSALSTQIRSTMDADLKRHLQGFQNVVMDQLTRQMPKADRSAFLDARTKYAKGMTLEPLVAKATGTEGLPSPALLMNEVSKGGGKRRVARGTGGDMADLAAIGQRFLKEPPSSGTAERGAMYSLLGGGAAGGAHALGIPAVGPSLAAGYALTNLYNRAGPKLSSAIIGKEPVTGGLSIAHPPVQNPLRLGAGALAPLSSRAFPMLPSTPELSRLMQAEEDQ